MMSKPLVALFNIQFLMLEKFNCPVVFYTGSYYESDRYSKMVDILLELSNKMDFYVADLYTDEEFNKARKSVKGEVTRAKGLGELDAEIAKQSMFTPEFQRIDVMDYSEDAINLLCDLMGKDVEPRREFIMSKVDFSEVTE